MASSSSPLIDRTVKDVGPCNALRKCSLFCQPMTLFAILALCIVALIYPFAFKHKSLLSFTAHPFVSTDHTSLHSRHFNTEYLSIEAESDLVLSLPGLEQADSTAFAQYSGYVDALEGRQIHYWFFEAQHHSDTAPLFFWTNGGPGCSGLCGLLTEHGPFWAAADDTLITNSYSWNKEVNIVYLEQPYGVGFSTVDEGFSAVTGDAAAVADFDAAIRSFIRKFPIFEDHPIYLASESFGGHYMPLTALEIMKNNELNAVPVVNLKGFMVGNPYTNYYENTIGAMEAFYGHGLMRNDVYETWSEYCYGDETAMDDSHCRYLYLFGYSEAKHVDHYAVDYDLCNEDMSWNNGKHVKGNKHMLFDNKLISRTIDALLNTFTSDTEWESFTQHNIRQLFKKRNKRNGIKRKGNMKLLTRKEALELKSKIETKPVGLKRRRLNIEWAYQDAIYFPCAADLMTRYLNDESVQNALNVKHVEWSMCNDEIFTEWPESDWNNEMQPYYAELSAKYPELKILIFSGDDDSVCGIHGTQYWLDNMGEYGWSVDEDNEWVQWEHNNQLGGYSTRYLNENGETALYFHTIRSAGHMVPQTQPSRALGLLSKFLDEME